MTLTPAIKGQLTKAVKTNQSEIDWNNTFNDAGEQTWTQKIVLDVRAIFARHMPAQQAKHAMRKYLANLA